MNQKEKIKLHNATAEAINNYRNWNIRKLMSSPASLHVMMDRLKVEGEFMIRQLVSMQ